MPDIHCVSFCGGDEQPWTTQWGDKAKAELTSHLAQNYVLVIHNAAFDVAVLRKWGVDIKPGQYVDTMVAAHSINPQLHSYSLASLGESVGVDKVDYQQALINRGLWVLDRTNPAGFYDLPFSPTMAEYAETDVLIAWLLWQDQLKHFDQDSRLWAAYRDIQLPFVESVISFGRGIHVDVTQAMSTLTELTAEIAEKQNLFLAKYPKCVKLSWDKVGRKFVPKPSRHTPNVGSPNDVVSLLVERGWVPDDFKRDTGRPVTSQNTLKRLIATPGTNPQLKAVAEDLADLRSLHGIHQQLVQVLTLCDMRTGMLYGSWHQTGTKNARLSSSQPKL